MEQCEHTVDLYGEFRFKVDTKGRLSLPAQFRKVLANELVVTRDPLDEYLMVFEQQDYNAWVDRLLEDKLGTFDSSNKLHLGYRRKLKRRANLVELDSSGRIMLPAAQREAVGITKDVVIVGNTGYFEIWDAERSDQMDEEIDLTSLIS